MLLARFRTVALVAIASSLWLAPAAAQASVNCTPDASWGTLSPSFEAQVAVQLNQQRAANGNLPALQVSPILTESAEWKSMHMSEYQYFAHDDPAPPVARPANQRFDDCGYTYDTFIGENIAQGYAQPSDVVAAWMASPGHRANILDADFTVVGIGAAQDANGVWWWTADFGGVADPGTVPAGTSPTTNPPTTSSPPTTTAPPVTTTSPPATTAPVTTTASATTTTSKTSKTKTATPTPTGGVTTVGAGGSTAGDGNGQSTGIAKAITLSSRLVAKRDHVRVRAGIARILYPLANDLDPEATPLHLVKVLSQPRGSHARVLHGGRSIRLRLAKHAHGALRLVYLVSTASGIEARGVMKITVRK
jgi:uncharacterized protein YkwD